MHRKKVMWDLIRSKEHSKSNYHKKILDDEYELVQHTNPSTIRNTFGVAKNKICIEFWKKRNLSK